jgi:hypothetical protein
VPNVRLRILLPIAGAIFAGMIAYFFSDTDSSSQSTRWSSGDIDWAVPADQVEALKQKARLGDNNAAQRLAGHYDELNQYQEEMRWLTLAASRGDCNAIGLAYDLANRLGHKREARQWEERKIARRC